MLLEEDVSAEELMVLRRALVVVLVHPETYGSLCAGLGISTLLIY